jgi:hypothetical protein
MISPAAAAPICPPPLWPPRLAAWIFLTQQERGLITSEFSRTTSTTSSRPAERCSTTVCCYWQYHDLAAKLLCCNSLAVASYVMHTNNGHPFRSKSNDKSERECKGRGCDQIGIFVEYADLIFGGWGERVHTKWFLLFWGVVGHHYGRLLTTG